MVRIGSFTNIREDAAKSKSIDRSLKDSLDLKVLGLRVCIRLDMVDCALVCYHQETPTGPFLIESVQYDKVPISSLSRNRILCEPRNRRSSVSRIDALLGHILCGAAKAFCVDHDVDLATIDIIGSHSHALTQHLANPKVGGASNWNTFIAAETGITTVFDFLITECGAPRPSMSPISFVDMVLLQHPTKFRACLDIDDTARISFIPAVSDNVVHQTVSRNCGPGTLWIDYAMRYCTFNEQGGDYSSEFAATGNVNQDVVKRFFEGWDYLRTTSDVKMAIEMFGDHEAQRLIDDCLYLGMSPADTVATIIRITTKNIILQYRRLLKYFPADQRVEELFICGPGAKNSIIVDSLRTQLKNVFIMPRDNFRTQCDAKEAIYCAHLALDVVRRQATQLSELLPSRPFQATGHAVYGKIARGVGWDKMFKSIEHQS
ncbi:Anhydro-N-acetylmuramic acid kinase [Pyrenochaeta sp. MPI-SDFR-AT-0127]|nr:Anhydro-N-acetylmuramic acid kinase [Pyrenochaeta sp. MPI-SDFR-AT-0127]